MNQKTIDAAVAKKAELDREVYNAWEAVYREQKKNRQFPASLGADFKSKFESLGSSGELPKTLWTSFLKRRDWQILFYCLSIVRHIANS